MQTESISKCPLPNKRNAIQPIQPLSVVARCFVSMRIVHGITVKVLMVFHGMLSTRRKTPVIAVAVVEMMIHVPIEMLRPMEPRPSTYEYTAGEPLRAIVTVGSAVVRGILIVSVRTNRGRADSDGDLRGCGRNGSQCSQ